MSRVMTGHEFDPTSAVEVLPTHGQVGRRRTVSPMGGTTVHDLLAVPVGTVPRRLVVRPPGVMPPSDVEVLDPSWLLDLHDPTLVITHSYVGPDRRRTERTSGQGERTPGRWTLLLRRVIQVVVTTTAVVAPLVLIATPAVPPVARSVPPVATKVVTAPAAVRVHRATHDAAASRLRTARIEAARLRASARSSARAAAAATAAAVPAAATVATTFASTRSAGGAAAHARTVQARAAARAATLAEAARHRAHRAAARAAAQAKEARHRADRAAARAVARSQHGGRGSVPSVG